MSNTSGAVTLIARVVAILDELDIPYALGGSLASSFVGEPRATADIDVALMVDPPLGEVLLERVRPEFYVPVDSAREAIRTHDAFTILPSDQSLKVDLFVLGAGLLDRRQIERRVLVPLPGTPSGVWVTSAEDQVLRKLDWYRRGGSMSDRQWRDVLGIVLVQGDALDLGYLHETARQAGLDDLLDRALRDAGPPR
ncbi:MAG: hypothetical protein JST64_04610 [Actinobacteria bacterium]|nr:hypothetical protein [Actinomycetota bacterium]